MIKCPNCGKRVLGQDLVSGTCSHCDKRLVAGDSSITESGEAFIDRVKVSRGSSLSGNLATLNSEEIEGQPLKAPISRVPYDESRSDIPSGSEQTFISDEFEGDSDVAEAAAGGGGVHAEALSGSQQTFLSDENFIDSSTSSASDSSIHGTISDSHLAQRPDTKDMRNQTLDETGGSEQTFISDDFEMSEVETRIGPQDRQPARHVTHSEDSSQTFISDEFNDRTLDSDMFDSDGNEKSESAQTFLSDEFANSGGGSEQTFVSDEFSSGSSEDFGRADQTMISDEGMDATSLANESEMKTFVSDDYVDSGDAGADKTYVTSDDDDGPNSLMKTVESVWGAESEHSDAQPQMTMKAREIKPAKGGKQTLVIKTKSLVESKDMPTVKTGSDGPEYELIKVLGEGGMGVVYDARQTSIDRNVALKMIKGAAATNDKQKAKFLAEVVVTGDLDHPNIVPIYDVGANPQGNLFYSMKKVQGTPWLKVIAKKSLSENIDILLRTADAVGFAHARGIVHRDLKPENIMLGEFGEVLVMDWGLAQPLKGFRKARSITETQSMGGTPAYMAPEMATGPVDKISPASDIYLLGAILYEMLTGNPPHIVKNAMKCLMAAARNEIAPTDKKGELVEIAMKAMATEPKDRYQDVREFQNAIREYQSHLESIQMSNRAEDDLKEARQTDDYQHYSRALFGFQESFELWAGNKRAETGISDAKMAYAESAKKKGDFDLGLSLLDEANPAHATLRRELIDAQNDRLARQKRLEFLKRAALGLAAAVFLIVSGATVWIRLEQQKAIQERDRANLAEKDAKRQKDIAVVERDNAKKAAAAEAVAKTEALAQKAKAEENEQEAKRQKVEADNQRMVAVTKQKEAEEAKKKEEVAKVAAISAKEAAVAAEKVAVEERKKAIEAKEQEEYEAYISKIGLAASHVDKNAFDAARDVLSSCKVELRNWEWGRLMHLCSQSQKSFDAQSPQDALAVDKQGRRFATGGWDGMARLWDRDSDKPIHVLKHGGEYVHAVAFSPDGRWLATGSNDAEGFIQIWDTSTGKRLKVINGHEDAVLSISFSKDGTRLLSSSYDKTARLWNVSDGKQIRSFSGHTWWVWSAAFSPDESRVVTAGQDGTAIVWDVEGNGRSPAFTGHRGPVYSVAFSPDGTQVVTAGYDRRVLAWNPSDVKPFNFKNIAEGTIVPPSNYRAFEGHADAVRSVGFSPDGTLLLSSSQDNTVRVWDFVAGQALKTFRGHGGRVQAATFVSDGKRILSAAHDNTIREWSIAGYAEIRTLQGRVLDGHSDAVLAAAYSRDQSRVITASRDRTARTWNALTGEPELTLAEGHAYLASTAVFFPGGKRLLTAAVDNTARVWDVTTGGQLLRLDRSGRSAAVALSSNAKWIVTGADDKSAQLWDAASGKPLKKFIGHLTEVTAVAFSPDDQYLATGDTKGHVKLWKIEDARLMAKLDGHTRKITSISFSSDGKRLLTASADNTVGQWDVASGQELVKLLLKHSDSIFAMQLVPGRNALVTSCADRKIRVWDFDTVKIEQEIGPFEGDIFSVSVSMDGKRLIAANSEDRTVRLFEIDSGREVQSPQPNGSLGPLVDLKLHGGLLWSTAFVPGSDEVLTVGGSDARLWDVKTGKEKMSFSPHGAVASARFSPDGTLAVTGSWDNSAKIWDAKTGKVIRKLEGGHSSFVNTAVFSPDGERVLTASDDGTAKLWNVADGSVVRILEGHRDRVRSASYSPKGDLIVTTSSDKTARVWDAATGQFLREFKGHEWAVLCAEFSVDGKWLVTGSEDNSARVWDVETAMPLLTLAGHTASVTSVGVSPDMARVITGSQDQAAKVWDAKKGKEILTLSKHTEDVTSVTFSPDGQQVLTGSRDGTAVIWLSQNWKAVKPEEAKRVADRKLVP